MYTKQKIVTSIILLCALLFTVPALAVSTEELMNTGNHLLADGAYDQAVSKFRKVIARDPGNFEAQFNLAIAYLNSEQYSNAILEFKKAIYINPRSAEAWSNLAFVYDKLGWSEKALNALYKAVISNPNNITARINLATVYAQNNRYNEAIAQYKQIIQIDGTNLDAHVNIAKCLISKNKLKEAKHYLKSAIAINPNDPEAYWELGNVLWDSERNSEGAVKNYKKAIALKPNSQVYYENLGLLLEELWKKNKDKNKRQEAIDVWESWLVYLDDALQKEKIQSRIEMLERGESPTGKATPEELFGKSEPSREEIEQLRSEVRKEGGEVVAKANIIKVDKYDVESELNDLEKSEDSKFDFDMEKAVEKKKKEKEKEKQQ